MDSATKALRAAVRAVNPTADTSYLPEAGALPKGQKSMKFVSGRIRRVDRGPTRLVPGRENASRGGWAFYQPDESGQMYYRTIVDAETHPWSKNTRLGAYQNPAPPRGLVFLDSPQPDTNLGTLTATRPYAERTLVSFAGDPQASPRGWLDGTETAGNNTITGHNPSEPRHRHL